MSFFFKMSWPKAVEAIHYLASIHPGITPFYVAKILYYADKSHMADWGRPICGDFYVAMENGPVPSNTYRLVNREAIIGDDIINEFDSRIEKKDLQLFPRIDFNAIALSPSDMEYLKKSERIYGHMSFGALRDLVHKERAWRDAWQKRLSAAPTMDMTSMIGDEIENRKQIIEEIRTKAAYSG
jgi:uncharacterized phage-associated protein